MDVAFGRVSSLDGIFSCSKFSWLLDWVLGFSSGMILSVRMLLSRPGFLCSLLALPLGLLLLPLFYYLPMLGTECGTLLLFGILMTGKLRRCLLSLTSFILKSLLILPWIL